MAHQYIESPSPASLPHETIKNLSPSLQSPQSDDATSAAYDLIIIGFGPAALATAIALHDSNTKARVLFIERQQQFGWHTGMLLPGAHMQISFIKDLATMRDPRSYFTFLNYLHCNNRLVAFTNMFTFTPLRAEFNDYLKWCAGHFSHCVQYGTEAIDVTALSAGADASSLNSTSKHQVSMWQVTTRDVTSNKTRVLAAKNVVVAAGGKPSLPACFPKELLHSSVIHSSSYLHDIATRLPDMSAPYKVAVIGGGQSAAEIFEHLYSSYPNARVTLFTRDSALRPSDDSPFVNEIFDSDRIDTFYSDPKAIRQKSLTSNKATNYSVVRGELLDRLFERLYRQRLEYSDPSQWQLHICNNRELRGVQMGKDKKVDLQFRDVRYGTQHNESAYDVVIAATGYRHDAHEKILKSVRPLVPADTFAVSRDYKVQFRPGAVDENCGIWLQGCCEETHGLSDSLLSVLATRSNELITSIFGRTAGQGIQAKL